MLSDVRWSNTIEAGSCPLQRAVVNANANTSQSPPHPSSVF